MSLDKIKSLINIDFAFFLFSNFLIRGLGYLIQFILIFYISVDEYGLLKVSASYIDIVALSITFGLATSIIKINSSESSSPETKNNNLIYSLLLATTIGGSVCGIIYLIDWSQLTGLDSGISRLINALSFTALILVINKVFVADLQSKGEFKKISSIQASSKGIGVIIVLSMVHVYGISGYIISTYLMLSLTTVFLINHWLRQKIELSLSFRGFKKFIQTNFELASYAYLSNMVFFASKNIAVLMIGYYSFDKYKLGMLSIALTMYFVLDIISGTLQQFFLPKLSRFSSDPYNWKKYFITLEKRFIIYSFLLALILASLSLLATEYYFVEYKYVSYALITLAFSWFISSFYTLKNVALISIGRTKVNFILSLVIFPIVSIFTAVFIEFFEVEIILFSKVLYSTLMVLGYKIYFNRLDYESDKKCR
ncbi:oligosaccharide flippase family protein [Vibrio owensii]|uniref:oligosaccharide flippase family protein n=1 Tax=Vibrio owensii TaxID=696485 RepID=UPI002FF15982